VHVQDRPQGYEMPPDALPDVHGQPAEVAVEPPIDGVLQVALNVVVVLWKRRKGVVRKAVMYGFSWKRLVEEAVRACSDSVEVLEHSSLQLSSMMQIHAGQFWAL
jgi:hypothetical protein